MSKTKAGPEFKKMVDAQMKAQGARPNQPQMSPEDQAAQAKMVDFHLRKLELGVSITKAQAEIAQIELQVAMLMTGRDG